MILLNLLRDRSLQLPSSFLSDGLSLSKDQRKSLRRGREKMRLKLLLTITLTLLLMTLLSGKTNASEPALTKLPVGKLIELKRGAAAPYDGLLLNEPALRFYVNAADENYMLRGSLQECDEQNMTSRSELISMKTIAAFVLGGLAVYAVGNK